MHQLKLLRDGSHLAGVCHACSLRHGGVVGWERSFVVCIVLSSSCRLFLCFVSPSTIIGDFSPSFDKRSEGFDETGCELCDKSLIFTTKGRTIVIEGKALITLFTKYNILKTLHRLSEYYGFIESFRIFQKIQELV